MKIFITGGTGFIGRHLVKALADAGHILYVLVRDRAKAAGFDQRDNIVQIEGEIGRVESYGEIFAEPVDIVYHLAAISGQKWGSDEAEYHRINVEGTASLLKVCRDQAKLFIFCSSINAIQTNGFLRDPYGKSKWQAEQLVEAAGQTGMRTVIMRPAVVYGPGALEGMIVRFCQLMKQGKFLRIGSGNNIIPLVYIDDLIEVLLRAANLQTSGQVYEIIGPERLTLSEIIKQIAADLGVKPRSFGVPIPLARLAAFLFELIFGIIHREPLLTQHRVDVIISHRPHLDSQKAERELGYAPRVHFEQGLATTIEWYQRQGYL